MSRTAHKLLSASGGKAYEIDQSVLLDEGDSALLHRTPSSEGNRKTWTYSCWFKRTKQDSSDTSDSYFYLFASSIYGGNETYVRVQGDHLHVAGYDGGSSDFSYYSYGLFRDLAAWYHVVVICDTTESAEADRVKIYLNGETVSWDTPNHASLNFDTMINNTNWHAIGAYQNSSGNTGLYQWDGLVAEAYLLDGTAKAVSAFGETDSVTGQWIPKKTAFTSSEYGTNGFYLKFVSGAIGTDSSGEGNNYTLNSLANADVLLDSPTNNYPTINSLTPYNTTISNLSQGNLHVKAVTYDSGYYGNHIATVSVPESGKWYIETRMAVESGTGNTSWIGVMPQTLAIIPKDGTGATDGNYAANSSFTGMVADLISGVDTIRLFDGGSAQATVSSATATSYIIALALDVDNNKVYGGYDSGSGITWLASGDPAAGSNGQAHTFTSDTIIQLEVGPNSGSNSNSKQTLNFGQNGTFSGQETAGGNTDGAGIGNFFYSPPSGFKALCTKNLPTPTIKKPTEHFDTVTYTGNDSNRNITSYNFQPDFLWLKSRETAYYHRAIDAVRGSTRSLYVNTNDSELVDDYGTVGGFLSNGFSLRAGAGSNATHAGTNADGDDMVAWAWKANGSGSANTDGATNTTATSANTTAGFSIMNVVGTGSSTTYGHGLGVVPKVYIVKLTSGTGDWYLQTSALDGGWDYLQLNTTAASNSMSATAPTSSVITGNITSSATAVYYAFAEVEGFSKFGSYTGNASTDGPYVYTGFRPAFILFKDVNTTESWNLFDNKRNPYNLGQNFMWADLASGDYVSGSNGIDLLSNGFKIRANNGVVNGSTNTWLYMAFAEAPFKYANAR